LYTYTKDVEAEDEDKDLRKRQGQEQGQGLRAEDKDLEPRPKSIINSKRKPRTSKSRYHGDTLPWTVTLILFCIFWTSLHQQCKKKRQIKNLYFLTFAVQE